MQSVEAVQAQLMALCRPLEDVTLPLADASGYHLVDDVVALRAHPPFAAAAMDGYAVQAEDVQTLPVSLRVIGESVAGARFHGIVKAGEAVRIFTGAPLPEGADCVVVQEDVVRAVDIITINGLPPHASAHIRPRALDMQKDALLLAKGSGLTAARLGLLAAGGHSALTVHRAPVVELLACGDELKQPGAPLGVDDIVATNGLVLATLLRAAGARVQGEERLWLDDLALLTATMKASTADILVTIGGASVGERDYVQAALRAAGFTINIWKVALKPGKPLMIATRGAQIAIGLPGNPVSAFVCAQLFVLPAVRALLGNSQPLSPALTGRTTTALSAGGPRAEYVRARAVVQDGVWQLTAHAVQDSSMLSVLAASNALLVRPVGAPAVAPGGEVLFLQLDS